jgi:putative phosphoribosyl transferase
MVFHDRHDAGKVLASQLARFANRSDIIVLALPRGGVPVGFEIARALGAPLDIFLVRKLGVPGREELAMGAIASGGVHVIHKQTVRELCIPISVVDVVAAREQREFERRERSYRDGRAGPTVRGRTVILVDDGLATGSTMRAAIVALRQHAPAQIIVAIPVGSADTCGEIESDADEVICAFTPQHFLAVGEWYEDFSQTTDEEVVELLGQASTLNRPPQSAITLRPAITPLASPEVLP